jgi:hypothetical protein
MRPLLLRSILTAPVACLLLVGAGVSRVQAASPPSETEEANPISESDESGSALAEKDPVRVRAEQLEAFLRGELDPAISADALFSVSASDPLVGAYLPASTTGAAQPLPPGEDAPPAQRVSSAWARFLSLTPTRRMEMLDSHRAARESLGFPSLTPSEFDARAQFISAHGDALSTFLEGDLDPSIELDPLLALDLSDPLTQRELSSPAGHGSAHASPCATSNFGSFRSKPRNARN